MLKHRRRRQAVAGAPEVSLLVSQGRTCDFVVVVILGRPSFVVRWTEDRIFCALWSCSELDKAAISTIFNSAPLGIPAPL